MVLIKQHVSAYWEVIIRFTILAIKTRINCGTVWLDVEISSSKVHRAYIKPFIHGGNPVGAVKRATCLVVGIDVQWHSVGVIAPRALLACCSYCVGGGGLLCLTSM
jgi:hypothetical protein